MWDLEAPCITAALCPCACRFACRRKTGKRWLSPPCKPAQAAVSSSPPSPTAAPTTRRAMGRGAPATLSRRSLSTSKLAKGRRIAAVRMSQRSRREKTTDRNLTSSYLPISAQLPRSRASLWARGAPAREEPLRTRGGGPRTRAVADSGPIWSLSRGQSRTIVDSSLGPEQS